MTNIWPNSFTASWTCYDLLFEREMLVEIIDEWKQKRLLSEIKET